MTARRKLAAILATTCAALLLLSCYAAYSIWRADQRGWAGFNYSPPMSARAEARTKRFGLVSGGVLLVIPSAPAARAGLLSGDRIVSINGIDINDGEKLEVLDQATSAGDRITYRIRRGDAEQTIAVTFGSPVHWGPMVWSAIVSALLSISFLAIGVLVLFRQPDDRRSMVFYAMTAVGSLWFVGGVATAFDIASLRGITTTPGASVVAVAGYAMFGLIFAALTLHLSLVFPHDRPVLLRRPYILGWIYSIPALGIVALTLWVSMALTAGTPAERFVDMVFGRGFAAAAGLVALAGAVLLLRTARRARGGSVLQALITHPAIGVLTVTAFVAAIALAVHTSGFRGTSRVVVLIAGVLPFLSFFAFPVMAIMALVRSYREAGLEERRQVKWPLWGTIIALGTRLFFSVAGFTAGIVISTMKIEGASNWLHTFQVIELLPRLLYLLIPISFAVAILKYRLMNIDVIIKKTVVYAILSGAIIVLYLILVGGLGTVLIAVAGVQNQTMVMASTLIVAVLAVPLRNRLQHLVDKNLFRQKIDYPQALRAIAADTMSATDLRSFLTSASEKMQQALQNRNVVVLSERGSEMIATAKVGVADSILGSAALSITTASTFDRPLDPRRRPLPDKDAAVLRRIEAALVVPARSHGTLLAVVALGPKLSDREFDLDDIEFASSAADHIALGIDRIRVQHDEADFEQARTLQQGLLPAEAPGLTGAEVAGVWQPARTVGGDYYDLLKLSDTQLAICIGDVAGKGMPAALLMSALQAAVRASADPDVAPKRIVERVRRVVVPSLAGRFVSFIYCTFDSASGRLRYCNAGHSPPIVIRANGTADRLGATGPVLSRLFRDETLRDGELQLDPGDRLVLFTDGVSEARNAESEDFGEERLEQYIRANRTLGARELADAVASAVASYAAGHPEDDLTLVTLAVNERAG